jgi:hypothetical protein
VFNRLHFIFSPPVHEPFERAIFGDYEGPCFPVGNFRKWHQLTSQRPRKLCVQDIIADISIFVIITDLSETLRMPSGQVFLEGCYQLLIDSSLDSSCGQLKDKYIYGKKCIISLTLCTVPFFKKNRHFGFFRNDLGWKLNPIDT